MLPSARSLESKIVHFSSCSVLQDEDACKAFLSMTGAKAITGFNRDVEWVESLAFEMLMFNTLVHYERFGNFYNEISARYGDLIDRLGFTVIRP